MGDAPTEDSYAALLSDPPLVAIALVVFVAMIGFEAVSPALPAIAGSLSVSDSRVGLVMTAFSAPMAVFVPVTGVLADLYGRRRVLLPSLLSFGLAGVAIAGVDSFGAILGLRAVQGLGFAGVLSVTVTILGDLYSGPRASTAMGIRASAAGAGSLVLPAVAGGLAAAAWQYPFLLHALAFPVAALVYVSVPETVGVSPEGSGVLAALSAYGRGIRSELGDKDTALLVAGGFIHGFSRIAVLAFVPLFVVRTLGSSLVVAGIILSLRGAVRVVVPPLAGPIVARTSRKRGLVGSLAIMAASVALIPLAPAVVWVGVLVVSYVVGNALFSPILKEGVARASADDHRAGVVTSMYVFQFGGEAVAPAVFGLVLAASGFGALFLVAGAVVAVYTLLVAVVSTGR